VGGTQAYNSDSYVGTGAFAVGGDSSGHGYAVGNANPTNRNRIDEYDLGGGEEKNEIPISSDTMGIRYPELRIRPYVPIQNLTSHLKRGDLVPYPCPNPQSRGFGPPSPSPSPSRYLMIGVGSSKEQYTCQTPFLLK